MINPQLILSLVFTYGIFCILIRMISSEKPNTSNHWLIQILIISSLGLKSYAFVVNCFSYGLYLIVSAIKQKSLKPFLFLLILVICSIPALYLITAFKTGSFIFLPLWFLDSMIESPDRLNYIPWAFLKEHYIYKNRVIQLMWLRVRQLMIFYFGNLGVRSFGLILSPILLIKKNKLTPFFLIITLSLIFSSIIPLLFIQDGVVWNTIQFWYYTLIYANILTALLISKLFKYFKNSKPISLIVQPLILLLVVLASVPTYFQTAKIKFFSQETISSQDLEIFNEIKNDDLVLIDPNLSNYYQSSFVSAYTGANIVLANTVQLNLVGINPVPIEEEIKSHLNSDPQQLTNTYQDALVLSNKPIEGFEPLKYNQSKTLYLTRL